MPRDLPHLPTFLKPRRWARHPLGPVLLAAFVFAVIGLSVPPFSADETGGPELGGGVSTTQLAPTEDLAPFRTMSRWGTDIQSVEDPQTATDQSVTGLNPELVKLGFIGLILTAEENAVRLTDPGGRVLRLTNGDSLPDGRTLVSVTDNALTLEDAQGQRQTLVLFPRRSISDANDD